MPRIEDDYIQYAQSKGKSPLDINWDVLRQKYPDWDTAYIRQSLSPKPKQPFTKNVFPPGETGQEAIGKWFTGVQLPELKSMTVGAIPTAIEEATKIVLPFLKKPSIETAKIMHARALKSGEQMALDQIRKTADWVNVASSNPIARDLAFESIKKTIAEQGLGAGSQGLWNLIGLGTGVKFLGGKVFPKAGVMPKVESIVSRETPAEAVKPTEVTLPEYTGKFGYSNLAIETGKKYKGNEQVRQQIVSKVEPLNKRIDELKQLVDKEPDRAKKMELLNQRAELSNEGQYWNEMREAVEGIEKPTFAERKAKPEVSPAVEKAKTGGIVLERHQQTLKQIAELQTERTQLLKKKEGIGQTKDLDEFIDGLTEEQRTKSDNGWQPEDFLTPEQMKEYNPLVEKLNVDLELSDVETKIESLTKRLPKKLQAKPPVSEPAPTGVKEPWQMTTEELRQESEVFDNKIQAEKNRLDKIDPNRQRFAEAGQDHLSPEDAARMTIINDELQRRENPFSSAEARERVQAKRKARLALSEGVKAEIPPEGGTTLYSGFPITEYAKELISGARQITKPLQFYPDAPPELRNAVRTEVIGGVHKILTQRENLNKTLYSGLSKIEEQQVADILGARDAIGRIKAGKGDPNITSEQAQANLDNLTNQVKNPKVLESVDKWRTISEELRQDLIQRGKLDPNQNIEDYLRHYVEDYTPEWSPTAGIPTRLRKQFRGYTMKAKGTTKAYRITPETPLDYYTEVLHDNLLDDFIYKQSAKYDVVKTLDPKTKESLRGESQIRRFKIGEEWVTIDPLNHLRPGQIYDIAGKRYRVYSPDKPYSRQLYPTEVEMADGTTKTVMAMGGFKRTYLVPEAVYKTFESFSERGGGLIYTLNKINAWGKSAAILSHYPEFMKNNLLGDTFLKLLTHPKKTAFLRHIDDGISFLTTKSNKWTPDQQAFAKWMGDQAILDATFVHELPHLGTTKNPIKWLFEKAQSTSQFRENIMRTADAHWLYEELKAGRGEQIRKMYNWIDTEGLTTEQALGKIARESGVGDYQAISKTYAKYIRGLAMPFGTWYLKLSSQVWRYIYKHPFQAGAGLLTLPTIAGVLNNRSKEVKDMWLSLPEDLRANSFIVVLGKTPEGRIKTFSFQTPQDALIGTKIFGVAVAEANAVINGEKTVTQAGKDTLKRWGIKELRGIEFLLNPLVRYIHGLSEGRDPMDRQSIYPIDPAKLSPEKRWQYRGLYFFKTFVPMLTGYISEEQGRLRPPKLAIKNIADKFGGMSALGVKDFNTQGKVVLSSGQVIDWETYNKVQDIAGNEQLIINGMVNDFIKSGLTPEEYYNSKPYLNHTKKIMDLHNKNFTPEVEESLSERITNQIENDIDNYRSWLNNMVDLAKTPQEKQFWVKKLEEAKQEQLLEKLNVLPVSVRGKVLETVK